MESPAVLWLALLTLALALGSRRLRAAAVTAPMVAVAAGGLYGLLHGLPPAALAQRDLRPLFEVTLALVVFAGAARAGHAEVARQRARLLRLALVALPATVALGTLAARALWPGLPAGSALFVATASAATDTEVARPFFQGRSTPPWARRLLGAEGGLTDGLLLSALWFALARGGAAPPAGPVGWALLVLRAVGLAVVVGAAVGLLGGWLLRWGTARHLFEPGLRQLAALALAAIAWTLAARLGTSGLTASFVAGLALARAAPTVAGDVLAFVEAEGRLLLLVTFALTGALAVPLALAFASWTGAAWALAALVLLRPVPVWAALAGTGLGSGTRAALGWMGPRGLPTVVLALLWQEEAGAAPERQALGALALLVLLSVVLHGLSARPTAHLLARADTRRAEAPEGALQRK